MASKLQILAKLKHDELTFTVDMSENSTDNRPERDQSAEASVSSRRFIWSKNFTARPIAAPWLGVVQTHEVV